MPDPREELNAALAAQAEAELRLHRAVHRARAAGWSWGEVADVLGVSRQAAHRRFQSAPTAPAAQTSALTSPADGAAGEAAASSWIQAVRAIAGQAADAWAAGDMAAVHAAMTSTARAALPQSRLRQVLLELEDLSGPCSPPEVTGVHEVDGDPLPERPGRRRAVVVRCQARGEHADPVLHVLVGRGGRVAGFSVRMSDALEVWPL